MCASLLGCEEFTAGCNERHPHKPAADLMVGLNDS